MRMARTVHSLVTCDVSFSLRQRRNLSPFHRRVEGSTQPWRQQRNKDLTVYKYTMLQGPLIGGPFSCLSSRQDESTSQSYQTLVQFIRSPLTEIDSREI
jgi:hypothetical protein